MDTDCFDTPPAGAPEPPPVKPYSGGTCPTLQAGSNTITSGGAARNFMLAVPENLQASEHLPVAFLWHWLGGNAQKFYDRGDVQKAVDHYRFIAIIPESKGDVQFKWPIESVQPQSRIDEELEFFDDMLSCANAQLNLNRSCVSSIGVSSGALFTPVLAGGRGEYLSSILSLSGGTGGFIQSWKGSTKKMPAMVLWGGPSDNCFFLMDFEQTSGDLENGLTADGHFFIECIHNCGHAQPPFEIAGSPTTFSPLWDFFLAHPYWLGPGQSPYANGLPIEMPDWCDMGQGSATPRTGVCTEEPGC